MSKELRFLYETTIKKQVEEKVIEIKEEGGQKIEISRTIKKVKSVKIAVLKPNRKLFEGAEKYYAKKMAEFIRDGLLPYSLVAKRYANDGGPLSEPEKDYLNALNDEVKNLEKDYFAIIAEQDKDKIEQRNTILARITKLNNEIGNVQNAYSDIFENTAEVKSRNKTIEWWVLHLAYIDLDGTGYKQLFGEGDHEERLTKYDEFDDQNDEFINECIRKLSYLTSFWFAAKTTLTKIDFDSMDKLYTDSLSEYQVEEDNKPDIKVEDKTPIVEAPVVEPPVVEPPVEVKAI